MAGIDTSIYQNALRPVKSVQDYDNEYMQGQQNKLALSLGQQKADEYTRGIADSNRLREVVGGFGADQSANYNSLLQAGRLDEAQKYRKSNADINETEGKASKQKVELVDSKLKQSRAYLDGVTTPEQYIAWHEANHKDPVLGPELAARGVTAEQARASIMAAIQQPGGFEDLLKKSALGLEKFTELNKPTITTQNLGGTSRIVATPGMGGAPTTLDTATITQSPDNIASNATSRANSAASNSIARERLNYDKSQPKGVPMQTDQGPMLVDPRTGQAQPVTAGGKPVQTAKAPTEFQGKSAAFGARAEQAAKIIDQIGDKYGPAAINAKQAVGNAWLVGGALEAATNKMALSDNDQKAEQAQRDFVNAVLRQESGAAIGASEFDNAKKQYFPQPGDGAAIKAQKKRNRDLAVQGLVSNAGRAAFSAPADGAAPAGQHSPEIESLLEKYK